MVAAQAHRAVRQASALILLLELAACGGGGGGGGGNGGGGGGGGGVTVTLSSVAVSGDSGTLDTGATLQLKATASYSDASTKDVSTQSTWSTSADSIASVSNTGLVTAKAAGTVRMTATFESKSGGMDLLVNPPPLTARFTVKTNTPSDRDVCRIKPDGDLDCFFDGTASGPGATTWTWTWVQGAKTNGPKSTNSPTYEPNSGCGFFDTNAPQAGSGFVQMIVTLRVRDASGRESPDETDANVRLFPQKRCGFGF